MNVQNVECNGKLKRNLCGKCDVPLVNGYLTVDDGYRRSKFGKIMS